MVELGLADGMVSGRGPHDRPHDPARRSRWCGPCPTSRWSPRCSSCACATRSWCTATARSTPTRPPPSSPTSRSPPPAPPRRSASTRAWRCCPTRPEARAPGATWRRSPRPRRMVRERAPDLPVEGPIQYDAAIDAAVARTKLPDSQVAGRATVFVFPDLNTGNNTYKAVQRSAGALAVGPILQGLRKPVNDLSRGATVRDIVNTIAITAIQAQGSAREPPTGAGAQRGLVVAEVQPRRRRDRRRRRRPGRWSGSARRADSLQPLDRRRQAHGRAASSRRSRRRCRPRSTRSRTTGPPLPEPSIAAVGPPRRPRRRPLRGADARRRRRARRRRGAGPARAAAQPGQPRRAAGGPAGCSRTCPRWPSSTPRSTRRCRPSRTPTRSPRPGARSTGSAATGSTAPRTPSSPGRPRDLLGRARRRDEPDRPPPRQRRLGGGHPRRPVGRHLDGAHPARGSGDGNPVRRPRPGHPRTPAPPARLVPRGHRPGPQPRVGPQGSRRPQRLPRGPGAARQGDEAARLAFDVYAYRIRKYVGRLLRRARHRDARRLHRRRRPAQPRAQGGRAGRASSGSASRSTRHATPSRSRSPTVVSTDDSSDVRCSSSRPTRSGRSRARPSRCDPGRH